MGGDAYLNDMVARGVTFTICWRMWMGADTPILWEWSPATTANGW
jgi:hypothetical protein